MVALGSTLIDTAKFGSNDVTAFYLGSNEAWTAGEPAELIKPTSIANSGGSASIGTNGQVTFSGVTSVSLNGVFSADFDNYVVSVRAVLASGGTGLSIRYRVAGSDASGANYTRQNLDAGGTAVTASRNSSETSTRIGFVSATQRDGTNVYIYGPYLAQPTATRCTSVSGSSSAYLYDVASTHSLSTSYDGLTVLTSSSSITGALQVYGLRM
jgi:hypothetical protein